MILARNSNGTFPVPTTAFKWAIGVHVLFFVLVALSLFWKWERKVVTEEFVFELVTESAELTEPSPPASVVAEPEPNALPEIEPPQLEAFTPREVSVTPALPPRPEPKPEPKVVEPKPVPVKKKIEPVQPPVEQKAERISFDQFNAANNKKKKKPTPRAQVPAPSVKRYQINKPSVGRIQLNSAQSSAANNPRMASLMASYAALLKSQIEVAWNRPTSSPQGELTATVKFTVSAQGVISNVRLVGPSGYSLFDQSVVRAVKAAAGVGPTPSGQAESYSLPFTLTPS